jgi:hypothetical protein
VADLLPGGHRPPGSREWVALNPTRGDRKPGSFRIHLAGSKAGVWCDFATKDSGDALDLVAYLLFRGHIGQALEWARTWLGHGGTPTAGAATSAPVAMLENGQDDDGAKRQARAVRLFRDAKPGLAGTPAAGYLAARGIDLAELGRQPRSLRFHPCLWNAEAGRHFPAMLAAVTDAAGVHVATHRTWLAPDADGIWRKAPVRDPKKSLGRVAGGAIRLWRGASGKPLAQAPDGETVVIGEGIETCLSVVVACPELRVLCAVSLSNMARLVLPPEVRTVILLKDDDGGNPAAEAAFRRAVDAYLADGRMVRTARPIGGKDFNDVLQGGEAA